MGLRRYPSAAVLALALASCQSLVGETPPSAAASPASTSHFWAQGMATNLEGALRGDISVTVPTADGGRVTLLTWAQTDRPDEVGETAELPSPSPARR